MTTRRLAGVGWASLILLVYYRRAWRLLAAGPSAWDTHGFFNGGWRPPFPWAADAAARALHGVTGALAVFAAAWLLGYLLLRILRCRTGDRVDDFLFRLAAGLAALSYLSLALAAIGWYRPPVVVALVLALAAGGLCPAIIELTSVWRQRRQVRPVDGKASYGPVAGVALVALAVALVGALAPEKEYDALWYHLWLPRLWLQQGHPVDVVTEYVALYPLSWELLYGDAMCVGGVVAAKLLHFACLPLLAAVVWQLTRHVFPSVSPSLAAALLVTTPTVLWEATTAYIDLALALFITLGLYALLRSFEDSPGCLSVRSTRPRRVAGTAGEVVWVGSWFRLSALCLGFAAAVKHLALVVVALVVLGVLVEAARRAFSAADRRGGRRSAADAVLIGLAALALALPWYWRAWSASGNPFFPEFFALFGARPPDRWDAVTEAALGAFKAHFGFGRSFQSLLRLPWNVTQHGAAFGGSLGPMFLLAAPGVVGGLCAGLKPYATGKKLCAGTAFLVYVVVGYLAVWASSLSSFQLRFLVPIVPVLAVLAAFGLTWMLGRLTVGAPARWLMAALIALNLPLFTGLHEGDRNGWTGWLTHVIRSMPSGVVAGREPEDAYLRREVPTYGAWQHLAPSAPDRLVLVLEAGGGDNFYATRSKIPADATFARGAWAEGTGAADLVRQTLTRLGVTHVLFDRKWLAQMANEDAALASPDFRHEALALEYEDPQALLYRVLPTTSSATQRSLRPN